MSAAPGLLAGQRVAVTGGASGIGRAIARRAAEEGARVALLDRAERAAQELAAELGGSAHAVDVRDAAATARAVDAAAEALGGLTLLVAGAGVGLLAPLLESAPAHWQRVLDVNLTGACNALRAALPLLHAGGGGSVVAIASTSAVRPAAGEGAYAAAKAGLVALTASMALEHAPDVRVNAVSPGLVDTPLTAPHLDRHAGERERIRRATPLGRLAAPEEVADAVVFLGSPLARFVTGQNLVVDGGVTLHGSPVDGMLDAVRATAAAAP